MHPVHRADDDFDCLRTIRLFQPVYGPDLAPHDFWPFGHLKTKLQENTSTKERELMAKVYEVLMDIPLYKVISVFSQWKRRLVQCIDAGGDGLYFDQSRRPINPSRNRIFCTPVIFFAI
jgi:hypothetical protein